MSVKPQDGQWYVITTCESCHSTIFLFRDLSKGAGTLSATYGVTCPHCQHRGEYEARHYLHQPADPPGEN